MKLIAFTSYDNVQSNLKKENILSNLNSKIESQNKQPKFFELNSINYHSFKIHNNYFEIERWPRLWNPFRGFGLITFELLDSEKGTNIKITIKPIYNNYYLLGIIFLSAFLILFSTFVLYNSKELNFKIALVIILTWFCSLAMIQFIIKINNLILLQYSKLILKDIKI